MARLCDDASTEHFVLSSALVTAAPLSLSCWFQGDDLTQDNSLISITTISGSNDTFLLSARSDGESNVVSAFARTAGVSEQADTTTAWSADTWHHALAVFRTTTSRDVYIDGGSKGSNTNSATPTGLDQTFIGRFDDGITSQDMSGRLAEIGIWNVALTDTEAQILAAGVSPTRVRPANLVAYWPLYGIDSPEKDFSSNNNDMTLVNSPSLVAHAPVALPFGFDLGWQGVVAVARRRVGYGAGYAIRI